MPADVDALVSLLDDPGEGHLDALSELSYLDADIALPAVRAGMLRLGVFGQVNALDVYTALMDRRCVAHLIALLDSEHVEVRVEAARDIVVFGAVEAIPALRRRHDVCRRGRFGDVEEAMLRDVLTRLGARTSIRPPLVMSLVDASVLSDVWPVDAFGAVPRRS